MAKRDSYEDDDDFLDEEIADWDEEDDLDNESDAAEEEEDIDDTEDEDEEGEDEGRSAAIAKSEAGDPESELKAEEPPPIEEEEEVIYPPDDEKALAALRKLRVRLDVNDKGNVWRAIFDDTNGKDPALLLLKGLPALKELWLLGTKVTPARAESFKAEHPKVRVFF